jgi:hypothetical protein
LESIIDILKKRDWSTTAGWVVPYELFKKMFGLDQWWHWWVLYSVAEEEEVDKC